VVFRLLVARQGIIDIVYMFVDRTAWGWKLFMGVVSIIAGSYIMMYPVATALMLPRLFVLVLGIWGLVYGVVLLLMAFRVVAGERAYSESLESFSDLS